MKIPPLSSVSGELIITCRCYVSAPSYAGMVELADMRDLGSRAVTGVRVRAPLPVPYYNLGGDKNALGETWSGSLY